MQQDKLQKDAVCIPLLDIYLNCTGLVPLQSIHQEPTSSSHLVWI